MKSGLPRTAAKTWLIDLANGGPFHIMVSKDAGTITVLFIHQSFSHEDPIIINLSLAPLGQESTPTFYIQTTILTPVAPLQCSIPSPLRCWFPPIIIQPFESSKTFHFKKHRYRSRFWTSKRTRWSIISMWGNIQSLPNKISPQKRKDKLYSIKIIVPLNGLGDQVWPPRAGGLWEIAKS